MKQTKNDFFDVSQKYAYVPEPADVDEYEIAPDGGLIYDPLSREAEKCGKLPKEMPEGCVRHRLKNGGVTLEVTVPQDAVAYEMIPIRYSIESTEDEALPVHVVATAFEEPKKKQGKALFDLCIPGIVDVDFEYLGHVSGTYRSDDRPLAQKDLSDEPVWKYPDYEVTELRLTGEIESADKTWFRFRMNVAGNTILDGDGNGTFQIEPILEKRNEHGEYEIFTVPENLFYRIFRTLYPGDSEELWISFIPFRGGGYEEGVLKQEQVRLFPGEYRMVLNSSVRNEIDDPENFGRTFWKGDLYSQSVFEFAVTDEIKETPTKKVKKRFVRRTGRNSWLHKFEEFMTSFDTWTKLPRKKADGMLYLQPAPFTEEVVIKLIVGDSEELAAVSVPVTVDSESLKIEFNPRNENYIVDGSGKRFPAINTQNMADMRANQQMSPYPEKYILHMLLDMTDAGVNYINTTVAFTLREWGGTVIDKYSQIPSRNWDAFRNIDAFGYMADCMRVLKIPMEGIGSYPYYEMKTIQAAQWILDEKLPVEEADGFGDPIKAYANGVRSRYHFLRWGDNYVQDGRGLMPVAFEDSRGWMRIDLTCRYSAGIVCTPKYFAEWALRRYDGLEGINKAWGTSYKDVSEINPQKNDAELVRPHMPFYNFLDEAKPFHDWSKAMTDFDVYRTIERVIAYDKIVELMADVAPAARVVIRTEGANWVTADIPADTKNQRYRHAHFSQRRLALIPEVLQKSDCVMGHADYTTLPYTPSEVAELTRKAVEQGGVVPMHLPQLNHMRDIAVNPKWGVSYRKEYNLKSDSKGAFIGTLCALYPWYKATYENGGMPGITWGDYLCDGYVTETQIKEMKFFKAKLQEALDTPEGRKWSAEPAPESKWRAVSFGKYSFAGGYIEAKLSEVLKEREKDYWFGKC